MVVMESWIEINLVQAVLTDEALLVNLVDGLVHTEFGGEIETWFFFWEPELRLRIRWRDPLRAAAQRTALISRLDRCKSSGLVVDWYEGAHGRKGETYAGEADLYGKEAWPLIQKDWMNSSEIALLLIKLERSGRSEESRAFHWQRRVHLFTNQLFRTWDAEVELCLSQALGYAGMLDHPPSDRAKTLIADLGTLARGGV